MEERVLVWASPRDAQLTCGFLRESGVAATRIESWQHCRAELAAGAGALVLGGELLDASALAGLRVVVETQPAWSDLPVLIVGGYEPSDDQDRFAALGNVSLLQRPLAVDTLRSSVRAALRARRRQYQVRALLQQNDEEQRRKDEFLAMLAHELRNPLAPLATGLQLLKLEPTPDLVARTYATMERQILHLTRLIDDLLDVSRITRRKITLKKRVMDARECLERTGNMLRDLAREKALRLDVAVPDSPLWIEADGVRVEQILSNLVTNAIKFTPPHGTVCVSGRTEGASVVLSVRDTGIGISPEELSRVFDLFVQTERTLDRTQGGLGIGLTIVRMLAELHGGTAEVLSAGPGQGTEAVVRLPAAAECHDVRHERGQRLNGGARTVLVIEDNADVAEMLSAFLRQLGHRVMVASDGRAGLETALRHHPDVVVCDIGLPGLNGFQIASRLRRDESFSGCLLIALTGYGDVADKRRAQEAGFSHHLTKPADPMQVAELIATA